MLSLDDQTVRLAPLARVRSLTERRPEPVPFVEIKESFEVLAARWPHTGQPTTSP